MTELVSIVAEPRDRAGKGAARATRRTGLVPGVIYGAKQAAVLLAIDPRILNAEMRKPGFTTKLFDIDLGAGGKHRCLARDVQLHPVTDQPVHVDFLRVSADAVVHVKVPVHVINQAAAPGVKRGGVVTIELHEVEVTCSPDNIPSEITVDLTGLDIGSSVHINDLKLPAGVKPYHTAEGATLVTIAPPTVTPVSDEAAG